MINCTFYLVYKFLFYNYVCAYFCFGVCVYACVHVCVCGFDLGSLWWSERALYWIPGTEVTGGCEHSVGIENST